MHDEHVLARSTSGKPDRISCLRAHSVFGVGDFGFTKPWSVWNVALVVGADVRPVDDRGCGFFQGTSWASGPRCLTSSGALRH